MHWMLLGPSANMMNWKHIGDLTNIHDTTWLLLSNRMQKTKKYMKFSRCTLKGVLYVFNVFPVLLRRSLNSTFSMFQIKTNYLNVSHSENKLNKSVTRICLVRANITTKFVVCLQSRNERRNRKNKHSCFFFSSFLWMNVA